MNSVNIIGRVVREPVIKSTNEGIPICELRIAIDDNHSKDDRSDFINVTVFGAQANLCERYLRKGFLTGISGRIRTEIYTDKEGVNRYPVKITADRIQFLQWPDRNENREPPEQTISEPFEEPTNEPLEEAV